MVFLSKWYKMISNFSPSFLNRLWSYMEDTLYIYKYYIFFDILPSSSYSTCTADELCAHPSPKQIIDLKNGLFRWHIIAQLIGYCEMDRLGLTHFWWNFWDILLFLISLGEGCAHNLTAIQVRYWEQAECHTKCNTYIYFASSMLIRVCLGRKGINYISIYTE